jgi:hypothetical protein
VRVPTLFDSPGTVLFLLIALVLAGNLLWVFARHSAIAVFLLLGAQVWTVAVGGQVPSADFGITVYPADVLAACAFGVGVARLPRRGAPPRTGLFWLLVVVGLTVWSTLYGVAEFGLRAAGNDSRMSFWYFLALALYIATLPAEAPLGRIVNWVWPASAVVFAALCVVGWAANGLHPITAHLSVAGVTADARPVPAGAALAMWQGALLLLRPLGSAPPAPPAPPAADGGTVSERKRPLKAAAAVLLMAMVVLLQHRTVWVAVIATAFMWWALLPGRAGRRAAVGVMGAVTIALTTLAFVAGPFAGVRDTLMASTREVQDTHSTLIWRLIGWQDLMEAPRPLVQWLVGSPFGSGYDRWFGGGLVDVSPHDYYVHVLLRLGVIGLLALLALYAVTLTRLARGGRDGVTLCLLLVGQVVFFVGYSAPAVQGMLLGLCLWQLRASRTAVPDPGAAVAPPAVSDVPEVPDSPEAPDRAWPVGAAP